MRIAVEIDEGTLAEVMKFTGETDKGAALLMAATDFLRRRHLNDFTHRAMAGEFDFPMTNDELEAPDLEDIKAHGSDR
jgi:Arc/MetJ family transcription regulator